MKRSVLDLSVGVFLIIGLLAVGWLSVRLGRVDLLGGRGYVVTADFPTVGGLKAGSPVEIAGVQIGNVDAINLVDDQARVVMSIRSGIKLQDDSIASIKTKGLIGEKYIRISPGGSDRSIPPERADQGGGAAGRPRGAPVQVRVRQGLTLTLSGEPSMTRIRPCAVMLAAVLAILTAREAAAGPPTDQLKGAIDRVRQGRRGPEPQGRRPGRRTADRGAEDRR